jgi:cbb3-type cytochrome oxidase cytochrome c subunit
MTESDPGRRARRRSILLSIVPYVVAIVAFWWLARPLPEVAANRRHFVELERQVGVARESRGGRSADRGRVMRLRAQARNAAGSERAAFESEAATLESRLEWGDAVTVRGAVLATPLVTLSRSTTVEGPVTAYSSDGNGCLACHVSVATPGFESYPIPFRTHPKLASYVGAQSPHAPSRSGCTSCHQGDGRATTFAEARHSTIRNSQRTEVSRERAWSDPGADGAMLPVGRVEAACSTCHLGERYQPGAPALNEAWTTLDRGGCDACHEIPGFERIDRRGPDLRRVGAKLTREWLRAWLANPRSVKPATWMPSFWTGDTLSVDDAAAIEAVIDYLLTNSEPYPLTVTAPSRGDASRGQALVDATGCLGCHVVGGVSRDESSLRRTFGQPLDGIGSKTTTGWLRDWVREPSRYSPATHMPNLRLTEQESDDVATYLSTLTRDLPAAPALADSGDDRYRAVIRRYGRAGSPEVADAERLAGVPLRNAAGRTVIDALGCFNCHRIGGFGDRRTAVPMTSRAVWLDADAQTVHAAASAADAATGRRVAPEYGLGPTEAKRLALALTAVAGRERTTHSMGMPWHLARVAGRTVVQERNCVGCHQLDGTGGDLVELAAEPSLGPPLLTPEGSRVQPDWLRGFLERPTTIRPWLSARMPTFGLSDDDIDRVGNYFRGIAPPNPDPAPAPPGANATAGKELFELLKCQQCHVLGAIPRDQPTANLAPDLMMAAERLQPEWIRSWLRNPADIVPGTRMPTFWPDYPSSFYPPLGKDGAAQVYAIREHVRALR